MKKILNIIGSVAIVGVATSSVVSCGEKNISIPNDEDNSNSSLSGNGVYLVKNVKLSELKFWSISKVDGSYGYNPVVQMNDESYALTTMGGRLDEDAYLDGDTYISGFASWAYQMFVQYFGLDKRADDSLYPGHWR